MRTKPDIARGRINDLSLGQDRDCTGGLKSSRDLVYGSNLTVGRRLFSATTALSLQRLCKKFRLPGSTRGLLFSLFFLLFLTHSHVHYFSLSLSRFESQQANRSVGFVPRYYAGFTCARALRAVTRFSRRYRVAPQAPTFPPIKQYRRGLFNETTQRHNFYSAVVDPLRNRRGPRRAAPPRGTIAPGFVTRAPRASARVVR